MAYDLHGSWDSTVGQNAPLYASSKDVTSEQKELNVVSFLRIKIILKQRSNKIKSFINIFFLKRMHV